MSGKILILEHSSSEGPGLIADYFSGRYELKTVELWNGDNLPSSFEGIAAVIAMGGPMNVYEEEKYPFLKAENEFIKEVVASGIPYLGVCLGAQLLAKACGAKVRKNRVKEVGWSEVSVTPEGRQDRVFSLLPEKFTVFQWHEDTFEVPRNSTRLAFSGDCDNQAFRAGLKAYGLQFHVEATEDMVKEWFGKENDGTSRKILSENSLNALKLEVSAKIILGKFEKLFS